MLHHVSGGPQEILCIYYFLVLHCLVFNQAPRHDTSACNSHSCCPLTAPTLSLMTLCFCEKLHLSVCGGGVGGMIFGVALLPCFPVNGSVRLLGELSWAGVCCSVTWSCISTQQCWLVNWPQRCAWRKTRSKCGTLSESLATTVTPSGSVSSVESCSFCVRSHQLPDWTLVHLLRQSV